MNKSENDIQNILEDNRPHTERLNKIMLNIYAVANIRYWYWCLSNFRKTPNLHEDMMQMDALTTSIVISYGRLFGEGTGTTKLNKNILPDDLQEIHEEIISLRHARYAHHGEHETVQIETRIEFNGSAFTVTPNMQIILCLGAPKHWEPLFRWLDAYMHEAIHKQLDFLSKKTGIPWEMLSGPAPYWV